jgi:hypothetical protein
MFTKNLTNDRSLPQVRKVEMFHKTYREHRKVFELQSFSIFKVSNSLTYN